MLEDKRKDLDAERQRAILQRLVEELSATSPDLYYQSTSAIAAQIKGFIDEGAKLSVEERDLLKPLTQRDIEQRLSIH